MQELYALEDLVADFVELKASMAATTDIITELVLYSSPGVTFAAASKLHKLCSLSDAMAGDAACFFATAFAREPTPLLCIRALAGFFTPLVPATAYVLERVHGAELVSAFGMPPG